MFDQVTLNDYDVAFGNRDVLIYVYANVQSIFRLKLMPIFKPTIDSRLIAAKPLVDKRPLLMQMADEKSD